MKSFIVSWHASGYICTFRYRVVAETLEQAKETWQEFVTNSKEHSYSWEKAEKAVKRHYGGYIDWKEEGPAQDAPGCYELPEDNWNTGSDHLND